MSGSWQTERGRLPREDPRAEVGKDVRVGVGVGPMEFKLYRRNTGDDDLTMIATIHYFRPLLYWPELVGVPEINTDRCRLNMVERIKVRSPVPRKVR